MLSSQVKFSADRQTDRQTPVQQYAPDLSMRGYKNPGYQHFLLFTKVLPQECRKLSVFGKGFKKECVENEQRRPYLLYFDKFQIHVTAVGFV